MRVKSSRSQGNGIKYLFVEHDQEGNVENVEDMDVILNIFMLIKIIFGE